MAFDGVHGENSISPHGGQKTASLAQIDQFIASEHAFHSPQSK
jgi:hypothetical protein